MSGRQYNLLDKMIIGFDQGLGTLVGQFAVRASGRQNPAEAVPNGVLSDAERRLSAGLMRVNHAGEVSAQALYQGQGLIARDPRIRQSMQQSAEQEIDHLNWCQTRIEELGGHTSILNPLWFAGSFTIGTFAGLLGDKWSLGFIAETEQQVVKHLRGHLQRLPTGDLKSREIIAQMQEDEGHHATVALEAGARLLPESVKRVMQLCSKLMTTTAYWL